ncbi:MAG: AAA family ATPase [Verrucomicrobiota bacterium]
MEMIIFIGIQAAGKSSYYKDKFVDTHIRLNMDMLRTRHREKVLLNACIEGKQPVVIDNTNPTVEERNKYIQKAKDGKFEVIGYYFSSKLTGAIKRNSERNLKKPIPEIGVRSTYKKLEIPTVAEGFDKLIFVELTDDGFIEKEWDDEI